MLPDLIEAQESLPFLSQVHPKQHQQRFLGMQGNVYGMRIFVDLILMAVFALIVSTNISPMLFPLDFMSAGSERLK